MISSKTYNVFEDQWQEKKINILNIVMEMCDDWTEQKIVKPTFYHKT